MFFLDKIRFGMNYLLSSFFVNILGLAKSTRKNLEQCKNKYKGKRCFIIGNGPSLTNCLLYTSPSPRDTR